MKHMLEALDRGADISHYSRLTFAMIARRRGARGRNFPPFVSGPSSRVIG